MKMFVEILNKLSNHHQSVWSFTNNQNPPFIFETQRIYLRDIPSFNTNLRIQNFVRVEFSDLTQVQGRVLSHPNECKSYIQTDLISTRIIQKVYGISVYGGNIKDFINVYSSSSTLFPFLFLTDEISTKSLDYNIYQLVSFNVLFVGFINSSQEMSTISSWNLFAREYLPIMFKNVDVFINNITEYDRIKLDNSTTELYVLKLSCETTLSYRYL